ncbi:molybdate transport system substrate-binding protein [Palleronia aestuarii]|uniref:Molybdate transport system substrate-binding protein n=1 Tax=Palleronia aestuarii TaxID=568105 RepID=A0A2W7NCU1_9RHOB|nr:molybdate ABC transporter substrate-binding protein [Palleronia aestuarii]PZX17800.1 molybdate transport system substrate-binding protein [Palleronia aestuarii]
MMRRTGRFHALFLSLVLSAAAGRPAAAEEIVVFAAASLTNAVTEIEERFEAESGHDLIVSLAGSSVLARQILQGAPADVFISANAEWMDEVEAAGLVEPGTRVDLVRNSLVLVAHGEAPEVEIGRSLNLAGMLGDGRLAMALVDAVPAGIYGKAALETLGLWNGVAEKVAQSDNVRTALRLVATGEAPYGIVYATDAVAEAGVTIVGTFPEASHPPIVYPAAALTTDGSTGKAPFLAFLAGPEARAAFERQGFVVVGE